MRCGRCGEPFDDSNKKLFVEGTLEFCTQLHTVKKFWLCEDCLNEFQKVTEIYIVHQTTELLRDKGD